MGTYAVKRLLWLPFALLIVTFFTFALIRFGPGDPVQIWLGQHQNDEVRQRIRQELGLDDNIATQYARYVGGIVTRLDFGDSFRYRNTTVAKLLVKRLPVTMQLSMAAIIISFSIGIPVGLFAALRQGTGWDNVVVSIALVFQSLPAFITAPTMLWVFALKLNLLPTSGWDGFFSPSIVMPALAMGIPGIAFIVRLVRASVLDVLGQDYIRTARAKGLSENAVRVRHILRNALIPLATSFGGVLAGLTAGSFITETYFGIPGMGLLGIQSLFQRDYPVMMAFAIIGFTMFMLANLVIDLIYTVLDPRIRLGGGNVA